VRLRIVSLFSLVLTLAAEPRQQNYQLHEPAPGSIRFRWIHGSLCNATNRDPRIQVVMYNEDTYILRENIAIHHDAPFTYLLMGNQAALLMDTGATANPAYYPLRATVDALLRRWADLRGHAQLPPLFIGQTSAEYRSQNQGLSQFVGRPDTTILRLTGHGNTIDLGGRVVQAIPTPGAHRDGMSFYDPYNALLHTGDLLFPGRIMIANDRDYLASLERLHAFAQQHPVKWVMGGQIDMHFLPGVEYMRLITYKPDEHVLQLEPTAIAEALQVARQVQGQKAVIVRSEFVIRNRVGPDERLPQRPSDLPWVPTLPRLR
jgi:hypothetical protein